MRRLGIIGKTNVKEASVFLSNKGVKVVQ